MKIEVPSRKNLVIVILSIILLSCILFLLIASEPTDTVSSLISMVITVALGILGGKLAEKYNQASMLGMVLTGMLARNLFPSIIVALPHSWTSKIWSFALSAIIARAGLYLEKSLLINNIGPILALGVVPVVMEAMMMAQFVKFSFDLPLEWSFVLSFGTACMSPGVVVPLVLTMIEGTQKQVRLPSIALAALSVDVLVATTGFGIALSSIFGHRHELDDGEHTSWLARGIEEVLGGFLAGLTLGAISLILFRFKMSEPIVSGLVFLGSSLLMIYAKLHGVTGAAVCAIFLAWAIGANTWDKSHVTTIDGR